jgi:hypothetical protein
MEVSMLHKMLAALGCAAAAVATLAAGPAAAQAADANPGAPCVGGVATAGRFPVTGTGFTPGAQVNVAAGGQFVGTATADAAGNFALLGDPPILSSINANQQTFQLSASDGFVTSAPKPVLVTRIRVTVPSRAHPTHTVRYRAFGFVPGRRIYLFVRRHGHTLGRFTLGKAKGPCGDASRRLRYMPLRHFSSGTYDYWFSHARRYSKRTRIYGFKIFIIRTFR